MTDEKAYYPWTETSIATLFKCVEVKGAHLASKMQSTSSWIEVYKHFKMQPVNSKLEKYFVNVPSKDDFRFLKNKYNSICDKVSKFHGWGKHLGNPSNLSDKANDLSQIDILIKSLMKEVEENEEEKKSVKANSLQNQCNEKEREILSSLSSAAGGGSKSNRVVEGALNPVRGYTQSTQIEKNRPKSKIWDRHKFLHHQKKLCLTKHKTSPFWR